MSQGRVIRQKRRRQMLDLLLNLSIADLLVGLVTIPIDLLLESGVVNYNYEATCQATLAVSNGKCTFPIKT